MIQFLADRTARFLAKDDDPADIEVVACGYCNVINGSFAGMVFLGISRGGNYNGAQRLYRRHARGASAHLQNHFICLGLYPGGIGGGIFA